MTTEQIIEQIESSTKDKTCVLPKEVFASITEEQAKEIAEKYSSNLFIRLPIAEIHFFEWVREHDPAAWMDLWGAEEGIDIDPYTVGMGLLPELIQEDRGFPICDLQKETNFYFTGKHLNGEEAKPYIDAVVSRFENDVELDLKEGLVLEIRRAPIDIWRFAYLYEVPLNVAKDAAMRLLYDNILVYTPTVDDMSEYLDFEES
jgi:hypothetical protein